MDAVVAEIRAFLAKEKRSKKYTTQRWMVAWGGYVTRMRRALELESGVGMGGQEVEEARQC